MPTKTQKQITNSGLFLFLNFYIPTKFGEELIYQLQKHKNPKIVRYKNKGHILTLIKFGQNNPF